jgi:restriction system protein
MNQVAKTVWGIHAGRTGDANRLFFTSNVVALGFVQIGDPTSLPNDREAFRQKVAASFPEKSTISHSINAGQLLRFVHEMAVGDLVVYPSKVDRHIHLGEILGPATYSLEPEKAYPLHRPVRWITSAPRTAFSQGALHESGSALSLFRITTYANEFIKALDGTPDAIPIEEDESIALVAEDIENQTADFLRKMIAKDLKGHRFTDLVADLLRIMGYRTRVSPPGSDGGVDIIAHRDALGFEPPLVKVQCKSSESTIGDPDVSALFGKVAHNEYGLFVAMGDYSSKAKAFAASKTNLRLLDGEDVVELLLDHYDQLESAFKATLPLKRVFVPQPLEDQS